MLLITLDNYNVKDIPCLLLPKYEGPCELLLKEL